MICHTPRTHSRAMKLLAKACKNFLDSRRGYRDPSIRVENLPSPAMFAGDIPEPPKPSRKSVVSNVIDFRQKHPVVAALESAGGSVGSNKELAGLMSVSPGESSKRTQEVATLLTVQRDGKQMRISLKKSA